MDKDINGLRARRARELIAESENQEKIRTSIRLKNLEAQMSELVQRVQRLEESNGR
jgi:hypothetical protein